MCNKIISVFIHCKYCFNKLQYNCEVVIFTDFKSQCFIIPKIPGLLRTQKYFKKQKTVIKRRNWVQGVHLARKWTIIRNRCQWFHILNFTAPEHFFQFWPFTAGPQTSSVINSFTVSSECSPMIHWGPLSTKFSVKYVSENLIFNIFPILILILLHLCNIGRFFSVPFLNLALI